MARANYTDAAIHLGLAAGIVAVRAEALQRDQAVRLDQARDAYRSSLRALQNDPESQASREEAFVHGIVLAGMMRDMGQEEHFNEEVMANEILAITHVRSSTNSQRTEVDDRRTSKSRLIELEAIREAGLITDQEYLNKRAEILAEL